MVKNGHFGRLYINSYPATQPSATTSHDPAASSPEKPSSTQAPGLEKSRGDVNHDSGPVDCFGLHDGSKGHPENTNTPLNVNEPPYLRRASQAPVGDQEKPENLPPHLRLLATPNNASISNEIQAIDSRSGEAKTRNLDQSPPTDPDEVFVPPKPKRFKPPIN